MTAAMNIHIEGQPVAANLEDPLTKLISAAIDEVGPSLRKVNQKIHDNPELAYKEVIAHKTIVEYLESQGVEVKKHAWGLDTSFEVSVGKGGRQIIFCAEYDALPEIGHACGHNLIATSSVAAFLGTVKVMKDQGFDGRVRLLGTPAEEASGGKIDLLKAGAFDPPEDVAAAIMAHPMPSGRVIDGQVIDGLGGMKTKAILEFTVEYKGRSAHASFAPWAGVNALEYVMSWKISQNDSSLNYLANSSYSAAIAGYNNVSLLRQQIHIDDRVSGIVEAGGSAPNVIPDYARTKWNARSPTLKGSEDLMKRVRACLDAGAAAAGAEISYKV